MPVAVGVVEGSAVQALSVRAPAASSAAAARAVRRNMVVLSGDTRCQGDAVDGLGFGSRAGNQPREPQTRLLVFLLRTKYKR
ncbi:hypothetical protein Microterr_07800 [Microbacterium terricola]|uniref:Secreted protein n=1 Tax=Microbacterium terricola TaxID=344163 RepID=A0ABM8DX92_9MICO|nr:hypothetical protein Microterr_07800 [Microbacterium terricola]